MSLEGEDGIATPDLFFGGKRIRRSDPPAAEVIE
jgi:hypothetical protein